MGDPFDINISLFLIEIFNYRALEGYFLNRSFSGQNVPSKFDTVPKFLCF